MSFCGKTSAPPVGRLAPSPTGALHIGNIRTFMVAWLSARGRGGKVVLRIEDLDHPKNKPGASQELIRDLEWLGFDWDEGPFCQSERKDIYRSKLNALLEKGLVYPCACTRKDIESAASAPHEGEWLRYGGKCKGRWHSYGEAALHAPGGKPAWRFSVPADGMLEFEDMLQGRQIGDLNEISGDFVVARDENGAGYALAVVVDDSLMGVTEVARGDDLIPATFAQMAIGRALGCKPFRYLHVPLVVGSDGKRLAKRHGDSRISLYRERGVSPEKIIGALAESLGFAARNELLTLKDILPRFDLKKIPLRPVRLEELSLPVPHRA